MGLLDRVKGKGSCNDGASEAGDGLDKVVECAVALCVDCAGFFFFSYLRGFFEKHLIFDPGRQFGFIYFLLVGTEELIDVLLGTGRYDEHVGLLDCGQRY